MHNWKIYIFSDIILSCYNMLKVAENLSLTLGEALFEKVKRE